MDSVEAVRKPVAVAIMEDRVIDANDSVTVRRRNKVSSVSSSSSSPSSNGLNRCFLCGVFIFVLGVAIGEMVLSSSISSPSLTKGLLEEAIKASSTMPTLLSSSTATTLSKGFPESVFATG